ncbi:MAG: winged helix DNA-binding domain-containing protein [Saprospiraceae bacterium]
MTHPEIAQHRLRNQQITHTSFQTASDIVGWLGAVQAQDYAMAKYAVGLRLPIATDDIIEQAIDNAHIIRTHILRPTWHFVAADDVYWMLELSAPQILRLLATNDHKLGLDAALFTRSNDVIAKALEGGKYLTREELMLELEKAGIATDPSRAVHFMMTAELMGIVCNGVRRGKQFTYALLAERVPNKKLLHRDEALAALALRYFTSHGPATVHDFSWWSGLSVTEARKGLAAIQADLSNETIQGKTYYFSPNIINASESIYLLPAFDEFMVSYRDRSASLDPAFAKEPITSNGIFKPIIVVNGRVVGVWKRTLQKNSVLIEPAYFNAADRLSEDALHAAALPFGEFLELPVEIRA